MVGLTAVALGVGVAGNVVSRSIVLDAIALWPVVALALPALLIGIRGGRRRALAPLMVLTWLLLTVGIHLGGISGMPSTSAAVAAEIDATTARLTVALPEASLDVESGPFTVTPMPIGGTAGVPVIERVAGSSAVALVVTDDRDRSVWFRYGGYRITLPTEVAWDLRVDAGGVDIDLRGLNVTGGRIEARTGRVRLGAPAGPSTLEVRGDLDVTVPPDVAVDVIGSTRVPEGWTTTEDGATAPVDGEGWTIRVTAGSVRILAP